MKLAFHCNEDWDAMAPVEGGRHCARCQHTVFDFTQWSRKEIAAYHRANPGTCGQYLGEQLEPALIPLSELLTLKHAALVAGLTLGSIHVSAQAPEPAAMEQTEATPNTGAVFLNAASEKPDGIQGTCDRPAVAAPKRPVPRKRWYVSGRFPFLHHRRPVYRGRMVGYF